MRTEEKFIYDVLTQLFKTQNPNLLQSLNSNTILVGNSGILDSLTLLQFITALENHIKCQTNNPSFKLLTLELIENNETVFSTIESCSTYLKTVLSPDNN